MVSGMNNGIRHDNEKWVKPSINNNKEKNNENNKKNKKRMLIWPCLVLILTMLMSMEVVMSMGASAADDGSGSRDYWIKKYGQIKDSPLYLRAAEVFKRVLLASDRRAGLEPALYSINFDGVPWAQSLADGSIILTRNCLKFCYQDKNLEHGDARLAFVLGHELAHQFNGDFWHYHFFRSLGKQEENRFSFQEIKKIATNPDALLAKELQADQYGILYAALAGYKTGEIVAKDKNFFLEWARAINLSEAYPQSGYPPADERAMAITARLREVLNRLALFHLGVISYHLGWYNEAISLFEGFSRCYPGREVYANIGTSYLRMAYEKLPPSGGSKAPFPFTLSFGPQVSTRAESIEISRKVSPDTPESQTLTYEKLIKSAIDNLRKAGDCDPFYAESKNTLGCAYILEKKYHDAVSLLEDALRLRPNDKRIRNNLAVVYFLLGQKLESGKLKKKAKAELKNAADKNPVAERNLATLYRLEGKVDTGLAVMECPAEFPLRLKMHYPLSGKLKPGAGIPTGGNYTLLYEILINGQDRLNILKSFDEKVFVLQEKGVIRLVAYKEPYGLEKSDQGGDPGDVYVSKEMKNGAIFQGGRVFYYFEF